VVGWGGRTGSRDEAAVARWNRKVQEAHQRNMQYCGSIDFLVDVRAFIDFAPDTFMESVCLDLDGKPLRVPWLWDHEYKGHPYYWFCFNDPVYRKYLRAQVERVCLAPVDGLHIDDYAGTSHCSEFNHGCFCQHCIVGFRNHLEDNFSADWLKKEGIDDIQAFDYKAFLVEEGVRANEFYTHNSRIPLAKEFQEYQNLQMKLRIREMYEYAEELRGKPLLRSVNSHASSIRTLIPAPIIDYFCGEVGHQASQQTVSHSPLFVYKLVEAVGDRQTATASGQDWAWIKANDKPGLVRTWIAQAYAYGSVFMVPHRQWCYTQELGTHWYNGKPEDFAFLYTFVRKQAHLLDGYASLAKTAILITDQDFDAMKSAAQDLADRNIPFALVYAANPENLAALREPLANYPYVLSGRMWESPSIGDARMINGKKSDVLPEVVRQSVVVDGAENVQVSLRIKENGESTPIVAHLLNQNYEGHADRVASVTCTVAIQKNLFPAKVQSVILHQPRKPSQTVALTSKDGSWTFAVNDLDLWAIAEFK